MNTANRGEIWMINLNHAKGREQSGIRPALIISDDFFNNSAAELVIVLPITSKKKGIPLHVQLSSKETGLKVESFVKCEDVRSISKERLISCVRSISPAALEEVEYKIKLLLGL